jgi:anti-sigma factor RsiW
MTCREVSEFLMSYLDDELEAAQREEFEAHLALCGDCVRYLESYEQTVRLGRAAFPRADEPAEGVVPERLVRAIVAARGKKA